MSTSQDAALTSQRLTMAAERQRYMSDMAKDTFNYFTKLFASAAAGAFTVLSLRGQLNLPAATADLIFTGIAVLIVIVGALSVLQIGFCLWRWYLYRGIEFSITGDPFVRPDWRAALFELAYCAAIIILIAAALFAQPALSKLATPTPACVDNKS